MNIAFDTIRARLDDDGRDLEACALSPDGRRGLFARLAGRRLFELDLTSGEAREVGYSFERVRSAAFLDDGRIAIKTDAQLRIEEVAGGRLRRLDQLDAPPGSIAVEDGRVIACGADRFGWAQDVLVRHDGELEARVAAEAARRAAGPVAQVVSEPMPLRSLIGPGYTYLCDRHPSGRGFGLRERGARHEAMVGPGDRLAICKPRIVADKPGYAFADDGARALVWSQAELWEVDVDTRASRVLGSIEPGSSCFHVAGGVAIAGGGVLRLCGLDPFVERARIELPDPELVLLAAGAGGTVLALASKARTILVAIEGDQLHGIVRLDRAGFVWGWARDGAIWVHRQDESVRILGLEPGRREAVAARRGLDALPEVAIAPRG